MKKIIAFGASSSIHSINKKLATYAASCVPNAQATILDLNDYEMPIFSVDRQRVWELLSGSDLAKAYRNSDISCDKFWEKAAPFLGVSNSNKIRDLFVNDSLWFILKIWSSHKNAISW